MVEVGFLGIGGEESMGIAEVLAARGYSSEDLGSDSDRAAGRSEPQMVFVGVHSLEDLQTLKRLLTDAPHHAYACGVPAGERALAFQACLTGAPLFFLPAEKEELRKVLGQLKERLGAVQAERAIFSGLRDFSEQFCWKTSDVRVSPTCRHLARVLRQAGFFGTDAEEAEATLALEESLVNSLEHGNLELDSSLRSGDALSEDRYEEEKAARLSRPEYGGRKLWIRVAADADSALVSIEDEGRGFDVARVTSAGESSQEKVLDPSGKGLALIRRSFTEVRYNERGNIITLVKRR
jgi:anti-sigma regulatory factor (Ser/Thr protein kinase)